MGVHVCVYQTAVAGWIFACTDFHAALYHCLYDVVIVLPMARHQMVFRQLERRIADVGTGHNGRLAVLYG